MDLVRWYALMTQPRHEKVVAEQLKHKQVEIYLPLVATRTRWRDRTVSREQPLFPGYVFTRIALGSRSLIYSTTGVVRMLSHCGWPASIDDDEIDGLKKCLCEGKNPEPHPYIEAGCQVRITDGPLMGLKGSVVRQKNQSRIVISITMIHQSLSVEVDSRMLETVHSVGAALPAHKQNTPPSM